MSSFIINPVTKDVTRDMSQGFLPRNNKIAFFGDSIALQGFSGPIGRTGTITCSNGTWTVPEDGIARNMYKGQRFSLQYTGHAIIETRMCTVTKVHSNASFDFVVDGYLPGVDIVTNTGGGYITFADPSNMNQRNPIAWANTLLGGYFIPVAIHAYNGYKSDQMVPWIHQRLAELQNSEDAVGWALVSLGTNDVTGSDSYGTAEEIWQRIKFILDTIISFGIIPIVRTIPPVKAAQSGWERNVGNSAWWRALYVNNRIREYVALRQNAFLMDTFKHSVDWTSANSEYLTGYSTDNIHPEFYANRLDGEELAKQLLEVIKPQSFGGIMLNEHSNFAVLDDYDSFNTLGVPSLARQILTNPGLQGTSGSSPTGWTLTTSSVTVTNNTLTPLANGSGQEWTLEVTSAGNGVLNIKQDGIGARLAGKEGKYVLAGCHVDISAATKLKKVALRYMQTNGTIGTFSGSAWCFENPGTPEAASYGSTFGSTAGKRTLMVRFPIDPGQAINGGFYFIVEFWNAAAGATIKFSNPFALIVDR